MTDRLQGYRCAEGKRNDVWLAEGFRIEPWPRQTVCSITSAPAGSLWIVRVRR